MSEAKYAIAPKMSYSSIPCEWRKILKDSDDNMT